MTKNKAVIRYIQKENEKHPVVIWSKSYSVDSHKTINFLTKQFPHVDIMVHEINLLMDSTSIERELVTLTGQTTIPLVFVHQQFLGASPQVHAAYESGELQRLLSKSEDVCTVDTVCVPSTIEITEQEEKKEDFGLNNDNVEEEDHPHKLLRAMIEHENNKHSVVVWYKTCNIPSGQRSAKEMLEADPDFAPVHSAFHDVDAMPDHALLEQELGLLTGDQDTMEYPVIFVDGLHLGGMKELRNALESGDLKELVVK